MPNQAIRQEIPLSPENAHPSGTGTVTSNGIVQLDTTAYSSGTAPTYYFEAVISGAVSNTGTIKLRRKGTTTDDASINGATSTANILVRSTAFTPPAGQTEYVVALVGDGTRSQTVKSARIIVLQSEATVTKTQTQVEMSGSGAQTNTVAAGLSSFWTYTSANWDGTVTFAAEVVYATSAANTTTITLQEDDGSFGTWSDKVTIVSALSSTSATRSARASFTPTTARHYRISSKGSTTKSSYTIYCSKIIVTQSSVTQVTKCEPQFLVGHAAMAMTTVGIAGQGQVQYNASEWGAGSGSITYKHAMDSNNASNAAAIYDTTDAADVSNTSVSGANQQIASSGATFTDARILETDVTAIGGVAQVIASRILCIYAWAAAASVPEFVQAPLQPAKYWSH